MEIVEVQQNVVPTTLSALKHPFFETHPLHRHFLLQTHSAVAPPSHPRWSRIQHELSVLIDKVFLKSVEPEVALREQAQAIEEILQRQATPKTWADPGTSVAVLLFLLLLGVYLHRKLARQLGAPFPAEGYSEPGRSFDYSTLFFLSPWFVLFLLFGIYPLVHSFLVSFCDYDFLSGRFSFVGLQNYVDAIRSAQFLKALGNTLFFALGTIPFTMSLALFCAVLLSQRIPLRGIFQAGLFLPVATSVIVVATIFTYLYAPDGMVNGILSRLRIPPPDPSWLLNPKLALPAIMFMNVWASFGYYTILFVAGLQSIPNTLYEAAHIDGANAWQRFWNVTLPQIKPILLFAVVVNTIYSFQVFPEIFTMTGGGPLGSTSTIVYHLYELGFHDFDMGVASAVAYILFIIVMGFSILQMRLLRPSEAYSEEA
ncbi:MAG: ABC transporter permease subunit [Candidatus Omnitrophica bacterium]|nr:ABC transporter permease subunit [Candidatus Omnitrophota bacterium]